MIRKLPVLPTVIVLIAVGVMIRLGFWQLDRLHQKEAMLARYAASESLSSQVPWPQDAAAREGALYRHSHLQCDRVIAVSALSGRNAKGSAGWAHVAHCALLGGGEADVVIGWSRGPDSPAWSGGPVDGFVAPAGKDGVRLVATSPAAGLEANAAPDPRDIPNNHLSYAVQWFLFAATALVIYALAVRKRLRD
jgi:surfeit locus 1 family protein